MMLQAVKKLEADEPAEGVRSGADPKGKQCNVFLFVSFHCFFQVNLFPNCVELCNAHVLAFDAVMLS